MGSFRNGVSGEGRPENIGKGTEEAIMTVAAYWQNQGGPGIILSNNIPAVAVRMRLPNTGTFVIWGKATVINEGINIANATVSVTTLDGATALDSTIFPLSGGTSTCVPLQSTLNLSQPTADEIVDIRCAMANGLVVAASLIAIPVDGLSQAAAPPPS
jgi:hypothetical protein